MDDKIEMSKEFKPMNLSLEEKVGQLFFPAAFINDSDKNIQLLEKQIQDFAIGGLTFFHSREMAATNYEKQKAIPKNDNSHQRLRELIEHYQSITKYPLIISIDAEWGLAMRVEKTVQYPYALTLGAITDPYLIFEVGEAIARDLLDTGIHLNLAPVFDINNDPANPVIGYRSFGEDKSKVAELSTAFYRGMKSVGVLGCAKHFPGHGDTSVDSHLGLPIIDKPEDQLMQNELYPFRKAIESSIDLVMPGHLAIPAFTGSRDTPASLSKNVISNLLRKKLGFDGAVITDALNMHAVSKMFELPGELELTALNAGNDILSFSSQIPEAVALISKKASSGRIEESFEKLNELKKKAGLYTNERIESSKLSKKEVEKFRFRLATECITEIKAGMCLSDTGLESMACLVLNELSERSNLASHISDIKTMPIYELTKFSQGAAVSIRNSIQQFDKLIVLLYVPNIKPPAKFGLNDHMLDWLEELAKAKPIQLTIIGNPYALEFIPFQNTERTILSYQGIPEFEESAANVLFGKVACKGTLPITV